MRKLLLENALESWLKAIYYCDQIMDGKVIFSYKKHFVSSLHNSMFTVPDPNVGRCFLWGRWGGFQITSGNT